LDKKYQRLTRLTEEGDLIEGLGATEFQHLFVKDPRNYSGFVLFNTHSRPCEYCQLALRRIHDISRSYSELLKNDPEVGPTTFFLEILEKEQPEILRMGSGVFFFEH